MHWRTWIFVCLCICRQLLSIRIGTLQGSAVDDFLRRLQSKLYDVSNRNLVPKTDVGIDWVMWVHGVVFQKIFQNLWLYFAIVCVCVHVCAHAQVKAREMCCYVCLCVCHIHTVWHTRPFTIQHVNNGFCNSFPDRHNTKIYIQSVFSFNVILEVSCNVLWNTSIADK